MFSVPSQNYCQGSTKTHQNNGTLLENNRWAGLKEQEWEEQSSHLNPTVYCLFFRRKYLYIFLQNQFKSLWFKSITERSPFRHYLQRGIRGGKTTFLS